MSLPIFALYIAAGSAAIAGASVLIVEAARRNARIRGVGVLVAGMAAGTSLVALLAIAYEAAVAPPSLAPSGWIDGLAALLTAASYTMSRSADRMGSSTAMP